MKRFIRWAAAGVVLLPFVAHLQASEPLDLFDSETAARNHCGGDSVVWLDVPAKTYWRKGQRGYAGVPKDGGYTCQSDAIHSGNRARRG
jgi:hypothetical protein